MAKHKTHRQSHVLAPMLVGGFGTELENRFAEMNNLLALQGVTTSDPLAVALHGIRRGARELGVTFERVIPGAAAPVKAPTTGAAPAKAPKAKAKAAETEGAPAASTKQRKARVIKEEQLAALQVAGSISEAAPYGTDESGRPLAPYGVKIDGVPKKRRGRPAASDRTEVADAAAPETAEAAAPGTAEDATEETEPSGETSVAPDDLDALLSDL